MHKILTNFQKNFPFFAKSIIMESSLRKEALK